MERLLTVRGRAMWRRWLAKHHGREPEVWLVFFKQRSGEPSIPYDDAVEEALCFGWIDSIIQRIDDDRYARKFTPRKNDARWSASNRARMEVLIRNGRMTKAGLAKFPGGELANQPAPSTQARAVLPASLERVLRGNRAAWTTFVELAPSYRRQYVAWVLSAKKDATRRRRLDEAMQRLERGEKLGMK